jgi:Leucine-rich repeat (LRR) protein
VHLKKLDVSDNHLTSLDGIEKFKELETVDISFNKIDDLSKLFQLRNLKVIKVNSDISGVQYSELKENLPQTEIIIDRAISEEK